VNGLSETLHKIAMEFISMNPATGEVLQRFEEHSCEEVERRVQRASEAFLFFREQSFSERAEKMNRLAEILEARVFSSLRW